MNYEALKTAIQGQEEPLAYLNEMVPVDAGQVPRRDIKIALLGRGKLAAVAASSAAVFLSDPDFETLRIADPLTQSILGGLVTANVLNAADKAAIDALGTKQVPRWQALGFEREIDFGDIARATQE